MTSKQIYVKLLNLRDTSGQQHFDRVTLAAQLLQDQDWVEDEAGGGGNENIALNRIEVECFGDICGVVSLVNLLELHRHYPNVADWKRHKFDLKKMWAEWRSKQRPQTKTVSTQRLSPAPLPMPTPAEFDHLTASASKKAYEKALRHLESDAAKIVRLEEENAQLRTENTRLKEELRDIKNRARTLIA
jgi:hypothetical protein